MNISCAAETIVCDVSRFCQANATTSVFILLVFVWTFSLLARFVVTSRKCCISYEKPRYPIFLTLGDILEHQATGQEERSHRKTTEEKQYKWQGMVYHINYLLVMFVATVLFAIYSILYFAYSDRSFSEYDFFLRAIAISLVLLYFVELFTVESKTWSGILHHLITAAAVCILTDFTTRREEWELGILYIGYVLTESLIFISLIVQAKRKLGTWENPDYATHCCGCCSPPLFTWLTVQFQLLFTLLNLALGCAYTVIHWDRFPVLEVILAGGSDIFLIYEQAYCIYRSLRSYKSMRRVFNRWDKMLFLCTWICGTQVGWKVKGPADTRPSCSEIFCCNRDYEQIQ